MMSYLDNAYDVTNFFGCFEKFFAYTVFLPSFIVLRVILGFFCPPPLVQYRVRPDPIQNRVNLAEFFLRCHDIEIEANCVLISFIIEFIIK